MKKIISFSLLGLLFLGFCAFAIRKDIHKLPEGPYKQSCRKCFVVAGTLNCECYESGDEWSVEDLPDADTCGYDIVNDHGNLACIPYGSYLNSCARCWMEGDTLYCMACKNRRGQVVQLLQRFSLPGISTCHYDVVNNNANLSCLPFGQYLQYCDNCQIKDGVLSCRCSMTPEKEQALRPVSIDLKECKKGSVVYSNGMLTCTK